MIPLTFSETSRLLDKNEEQDKCCSWINWSLKTRAQAFKVAYVATLIFSTAGTVNSIYNTIDTLQRYPLLNYNSIAWLVSSSVNLLTTIGFTCYLTSLKCHFNTIHQSYPHQKYHQGSLFTFLAYSDHVDSAKDIETWKPYVRQFLEGFKDALFLPYWFAFKKFNDIEEALESLCQSLQIGLCYGYSMALLACMRKHADKNSLELLGHLHLETIIAFQLLQQFIVDCMNDRDAFEALCSSIRIYKNLKQTDLSEREWRSKEFLFLSLLNLDFNTTKMWSHEYLHKIGSSNSQRLKKVVVKGMLNIKRKQQDSKTITMAGIIKLKESKEDQATEGVHPGHALFFQLSDGYYRFHDSGSSLVGFFEFPNKELFFENLINHVNTWPEYKMGRLQFTILGIPHEIKRHRL